MSSGRAGDSSNLCQKKLYTLDKDIVQQLLEILFLEDSVTSEYVIICVTYYFKPARIIRQQ